MCRTWFLIPDAFALVLWLKTGGLAGFALGSNKIANCSNTTVYVGVTMFALMLPVGVLVGFEAARFLSATVVGQLIAGRERHVPWYSFNDVMMQ